jgi:hypothetical protein
MGKLFITVGIMIIMMSCGKDIDQFIPRSIQAPSGDISRLMTRLQTDIAGDVETHISCPCSGDIAFRAADDLLLVIPPDFVDLTLYPCTNGSFDITVTTCATKGDILISGIPTISDGSLLESRIEFDLDITDDGTPVKLAHGKQIRVLVDDPDPRDRMELFYGDGEQWIQADDDINSWDNVMNSEWVITQDSQDIITGFGYECFSDSLDWINVDVFTTTPADLKTSVCIELPEEFTNKNTTVFMVFDDYKSVLKMHGDAETMQFCEPYGATPVGYNVTFVVLSEMGDDCYLFATQSSRIEMGHFESIIPKKTPYEEIKNYVTTL